MHFASHAARADLVRLPLRHTVDLPNQDRDYGINNLHGLAQRVRPHRGNLLQTLTRSTYGFHPRAGLTVTALAIGFLVGLTACSGSPEPSPTYGSVVGKTLFEARPLLPDSIKIYDLSFPILNVVASYRSGSFDGLWTVVAQCPAIDAGAVAVIPTESYTGAVRVKAESGGFNSMLLECQ
jgi:hypothetical protein